MEKPVRWKECPHCHGEDIKGGQFYFENDSYWVKSSCMNPECLFAWQERFDFARNENITGTYILGENGFPVEEVDAGDVGKDWTDTTPKWWDAFRKP